MKKSFKLYSCFPTVVARINRLPANLFYYIIFHSDKRGEIIGDKITKMAFLQKMKEAGISYSYNSVGKAFTRLINSGLLIRMCKGRYRMNKEIVQK